MLLRFFENRGFVQGSNMAVPLVDDGIPQRPSTAHRSPKNIIQRELRAARRQAREENEDMF